MSDLKHFGIKPVKAHGVKNFKLSEVKVGMKVKLVAGIDEEGNPTFMFVPLTGR